MRVPKVVRETEFVWQVRVYDKSMQANSCKAMPSGELHTELTHSGSVYCKRNASNCCNICCLSYFFSFVFVYIMNPHYFSLVVLTLRLSPPISNIYYPHIFSHFIKPPNGTSAFTPTAPGLLIVSLRERSSQSHTLQRYPSHLSAVLLRSPYLSGSLYGL